MAATVNITEIGLDDYAVADMCQIRQRVRDFISSELRLAPVDQRLRAIQDFAMTLTGMNSDQQDTLVAYFASCFLHNGDSSGNVFRHFLLVPLDYPLFLHHRAQVVEFIVDKLAKLRAPIDISRAILDFVVGNLSDVPLAQRQILAHEIPWHVPLCPERECICAMFDTYLYEQPGTFTSILQINEEFDDEALATAQNRTRGDASLPPATGEVVEIEIEVVERRNDYPESDWFPEEEDIPEVEAFVEDFVWLELSTKVTSEHERAVENWAKSWPPGMTEDQQNHVRSAFESALRHYQLPLDLSISLYHNLPVPVRRNTSYDESNTMDEYDDDDDNEDEDGDDEADYDDDDSTVTAYELPSWFQPTLFEDQGSQPMHIPSYTAEFEGFETLNEIHDWLCDLLTSKAELENVRRKLNSMVMEGPDMQDDKSKSRTNALGLLQRASINLREAFVPNPGILSLEVVASLYLNLEVVENIMLRVRDSIFAIETYLVKQEKASLLSNDKKFLGYASRYERSRYRHSVKSMIAQLRTPRLRKVFSFSPTAELKPIIRPHKEEDECPICHENLQGEGEVTSPPAVTHRCCKKPFHVDCLLKYMFGKVPEEVITCPMCRTPLDLDFLGEVMEMKVREVQCL